MRIHDDNKKDIKDIKKKKKNKTHQDTLIFFCIEVYSKKI